MKASEILAEAHKRMTPEDIAAHALIISDLLRSYATAAFNAYKTLGQLRHYVDTADRAYIEAHSAIRDVHALFASGQKRAAREFLSKLAAIEMVKADLVWPDPEQLKPIEDWMFNPPNGLAEALAKADEGRTEGA